MIWPFQSRNAYREDAETDERLDDLDDRLDRARCTVEHNARRVDTARSRAEKAAARRAAAIEANGFDKLLIRDLRGDHR